ncbi:uncharacterized protein LOC124259009 [Haliotis rubra]|uniref:uncharacterized protein LOC124259009 n=1 Tax=Haliotis rubra TaxID=36100 RepID=UPI001EE50341|nr:uncharacterized protein LOC124259009 [Haliotis rubra]
MSEPESKQDLMRFLGIIQYLGKFKSTLSHETAVLRELMANDIVWHWTESHKQCFQKLKYRVTDVPILQYYDVNQPVTLSKYDLDVSYKPGKELIVPDALSRAFLPASDEWFEDTDYEVNFISMLPMTPEKVTEFKDATANDVQLQQLKSIVPSGWPDDRQDVPVLVRDFWNIRDEIKTVDGLLFKGVKLIVPSQLQE